jgi:uncharacterized protein YdbL (DUF1318 family)
VPVTVNINFPQEKLEGAAGSIEDMVRSPENPAPATPPKKNPQGSFFSPLLRALGPREASAQGRSVEVVPDVKVRTPELMKAIESRRGRNAAIQQWKARGCIGETNQGLLEPRPGQGCGGEVAQLVGAENADRQYIYDTLMKQNNIPATDAGRVRAAFAHENRGRAKTGEWIQENDGRWRKK